jgi:hypothetical protein
VNLSRKIQLADGTKLCTLDDARSYLSKLSEDDRQCSLWQIANARLEDAAEGHGMIARATDAIYRALFLEGKLKPRRKRPELELRSSAAR